MNLLKSKRMETFEKIKRYISFFEAKYTGWKFPSNNNLIQEYNIEYRRHFKNKFGNIFWS